MDKGEIRAATVHELGCKFEDMLEASKQDESRNEGAKGALHLAAKKVSELQAHVDKDLDEGVFANLDGPLAVAALVKKYITRACSILESGAVTAENHRLMAQGRSTAFHQMIDNMKKLHDLETEKVAQKKAADAEGVLRRAVGTHPGVSLKEQRKLEETPLVVKAVKKRGRTRKAS